MSFRAPLLPLGLSSRRGPAGGGAGFLSPLFFLGVGSPGVAPPGTAGFRSALFFLGVGSGEGVPPEPTEDGGSYQPTWRPRRR
jgi:hypothetical protein